MRINTQTVNIGLITQNRSSIEQLENKLKGKDLKEITTNTLKEITSDELKKMRESERNKSVTLEVDCGELITNYYLDTRDNVTFKVNGVVFSNEEMQASKRIIREALSYLPEKGSDLDYSDYASMGIATNIVNTYAKENLSKEQVGVLNKSIENYLDGLVKLEKERQDKDGYFVGDTASESDIAYYYNKRDLSNQKVVEEVGELVNSQNIPELTRSTLLNNVKGLAEREGVVQSASNHSHAQAIKQLFENVDLEDEEELSRVLQTYNEMMTPAYLSYGLSDDSNNKSLTNVLKQDVNSFFSQIANMKVLIDNIGFGGIDYFV